MRLLQVSSWLACAALFACNGLLGIDSLQNVDCVGDGCPDAGEDATPNVDAGLDGNFNADGGNSPPCPVDAGFLSVARNEPCSFATISDAIDAARQSHSLPTTIYVAPGTYSRETGERFPLDLRGGISLEGVDIYSKPIIVGLGYLSHSVEGGSQTSMVRATIVTGGVGVSSSIRTIEIHSNEDADRQMFGIFCDRGNAASTLPEPAPNLVVDDVRVGAAYGVGIFVSNSTNPRSGCNAQITRTTVGADNIIGVKAGGCDGSPTSAVMAVDVGGPLWGNGNEFDSVGKDDKTGGVVLDPCTAAASVRNNSFYAGPGAGVVIDQNGTRSTVSITTNTFDGETFGGVHLLRGSIDDLSGNDFKGCGGAAIWVEAAGLAIARARNNTLVGNRTGVTIYATTGIYDFGTDASPGGNDFRCNSIAAGEPGFGYDLGVAFVPPAATLLFSGNRWDHVPPTVASGDAPDGTDVVQSPTGAPPQLNGASLSTLECAPGRLP